MVFQYSLEIHGLLGDGNRNASGLSFNILLKYTFKLKVIVCHENGHLSIFSWNTHVSLAYGGDKRDYSFNILLKYT